LLWTPTPPLPFLFLYILHPLLLYMKIGFAVDSYPTPCYKKGFLAKKIRLKAIPCFVS
jgi:hypothetical protein